LFFFIKKEKHESSVVVDVACILYIKSQTKM